MEDFKAFLAALRGAPAAVWRHAWPWFTGQSLRGKAITIGSIATLLLLTCCGGLAAIGNALPTATTSSSTGFRNPPPTITVDPGLAAAQATDTAIAAATAAANPTATMAAATPTPKPTAAATATTAPKPNPTATKPPSYPAINGNPWGYTFSNTGKLLYNPVSQFCTSGYFKCVTSFWTSTNGYVAQCNNGLFTHSGGVRNVCSKDGGEGRAVYQR